MKTENTKAPSSGMSRKAGIAAMGLFALQNCKNGLGDTDVVLAAAVVIVTVVGLVAQAILDAKKADIGGDDAPESE